MDTIAIISLSGNRRITFDTYPARGSIRVRIEKSLSKGNWETECEADGVPLYEIEHVGRVMREAVMDKRGEK